MLGEQMLWMPTFVPQEPAPEAGVPETTVIPAGKTNWKRSTNSAPVWVMPTLNVNVLFCPGR